MRVPKAAFTRCVPRSPPLQPNLRLNRPLPLTSRRDYPLTSPSRALRPLVIVTSLIGSTGLRSLCDHVFDSIATLWPKKLTQPFGALYALYVQPIPLSWVLAMPKEL